MQLHLILTQMAASQRQPSTREMMEAYTCVFFLYCVDDHWEDFLCREYLPRVMRSLRAAGMSRLKQALCGKIFRRVPRHPRMEHISLERMWEEAAAAAP